MHSTRTFVIRVMNNRVFYPPPPWEETSHVAAAVIVTRALLPDCPYLLLRHAWNKQICWQKLKKDENSAHRLDHSDVIVRGSLCRTAKLNSKPSVTHLQKLIWDQTQANTWIEQLEAHTSNQVSQFMPTIQYYPCNFSYLSTEGVTMLNGFP